MADSLTLPRPNVPLVDGRGLPSLAWFQFFRSLQIAQATTAPVAPTFNPGDYLSSATNVSGPFSVAVTGSLISGAAQFRLVGDLLAPGNTTYYGTGPTGAKGYAPIANALAQGSNITLTVGSDGVTTIAASGGEQTYQRIDAAGDIRVAADGSLRTCN